MIIEKPRLYDSPGLYFTCFTKRPVFMTYPLCELPSGKQHGYLAREVLNSSLGQSRKSLRSISVSGPSGHCGQANRVQGLRYVIYVAMEIKRTKQQKKSKDRKQKEIYIRYLKVGPFVEHVSALKIVVFFILDLGLS